MIKRILSVVICVLMVAAVFAVSASAASPIELKISTNVTNAQPGDVLEYEVDMAPASGVGAIMFTLDIPDGMTFVSGSVVDKSALGFDYLAFTEDSLLVNGYASEADYSSDSATALAYFTLKVNDDAEGDLSVTLTDVEVGSCQPPEFEIYETYVQSSNIYVDGDTPVDPTSAPVDPTVAPVDPTEEPTAAPEEPTVAPEEPTKAPATEDSTVAPSQGGKSTPDSGKGGKADTATKDSTSPKTSDSGMIFVWIGLFALAILGVAGTFVFKKVRK